MNAKDSELLGKRVWIADFPSVPKNLVGAAGTAEGFTGRGRVLVVFDPDDAIVRRLGVRGVYIAPAALTTVNPHAPALKLEGFQVRPDPAGKIGSDNEHGELAE